MSASPLSSPVNNCSFRKLLGRPSSTAQAGANSAQDAPSQAFCDSTLLAKRESSPLSQELPEVGSGPSGCPAWCQPHF